MNKKTGIIIGVVTGIIAVVAGVLIHTTLKENELFG